MKNPFSPSNSVVNKPNRNAYDLSHTNHLTFNFGELIPAGWWETLPGDTFEIDSALGLRFMPLAFPIQTKCKAYVHFFYQRLKNLHKDFQDFIFGNDRMEGYNKIVPPYISFNGTNKDLLRTCSLGDYLGLPTVRYNKQLDPNFLTITYPTLFNDNKLRAFYSDQDLDAQYFPTNDRLPEQLVSTNVVSLDAVNSGGVTTYPGRDIYSVFFVDVVANTNNVLSDSFVTVHLDIPPTIDFDTNSAQGVIYLNSNYKCLGVYNANFEHVDEKLIDSAGWIRASFTFPADVLTKGNTLHVGIVGRFTDFTWSNKPVATFEIADNLTIDAIQSKEGSQLTDTTKYHISAYPFRCYESIYNAFYRDNRNNPLIISDAPVYNEYITNNRSGADTTDYHIFNRNWEYDQFTSAVSSPQQGVAPLVGISQLGDTTFSLDGKSYTFSTETAEDADTITKVNVTENVPNEVARAAMDVATSGISINDFRNVNAFQRWLETNIRRGLKYKDQALARFGVEPKDSTLDMPEFIGGFSVDVDVNTVTNTNGADGSTLGDYAGQASAFGGSKHKISHYCDQHGIIMAIVSVVPVPVYTQLLNKKFLRTSALDYFAPEFGQIGLQSVKYKELCPLEIPVLRSGDQITAEHTFGYQRPWYEYMYCNDEAHGLFRTDFNQFIMARYFSKPPTLGSDFLTVKPSSLNNVFSVTNRNNILGMIRFNMVAKRPIPSVSIPSL